MDQRLQGIIHRHENEFAEWRENIMRYQEHFILPCDHFDDEFWENNNTDIDIDNLLRQLLGIFVTYAAKETPWEWNHSLDYGTGVSAGVAFPHMEHFYTLGVSKDSLYLETMIAHPESIHKMFDRFVQAVADYSRFGIFSYNESEVFSENVMRAYRPMLKKRIKGQLADFLRQHFIAEAEYNGDFDFGFLEVRWPLDRYSMNQILTEGCKAFDTIHKLNVALWKKSQPPKPKGAPGR